MTIAADRRSRWATSRRSSAAPAPSGTSLARLEADADRDGFGDETQDQCPTDASTQGACPVTPVTPAPSVKKKKCKKHKKKHSAESAKKKKCKKKKIGLEASDLAAA